MCIQKYLLSCGWMAWLMQELEELGWWNSALPLKKANENHHPISAGLAPINCVMGWSFGKPLFPAGQEGSVVSIYKSGWRRTFCTSVILGVSCFWPWVRCSWRRVITPAHGSCAFFSLELLRAGHLRMAMWKLWFVWHRRTSIDWRNVAIRLLSSVQVFSFFSK